MFIYKAGVVGGGLMGSGIAQVVSFSGLPVVLKDTSPELVDKGIKNIRAVYEGRVKKGRMSPEDVEKKMALVTGTTSWDDFKDVDFAVEAVFETMDVKRQVFAELDAACPSHAILATNTSALSISAIAAATKRPAQVVGMHFFYPAPVMKLVEVIPGLATSDDTVKATVEFTESLRKIPVKVKECAGFLVNRLLLPFLNEAAVALQEGAAPAKDIDAAVVKFGLPMGPFILMDTLGLDVCYHVAGTLHDSYGERARTPKIFEALYERKRFGQKNGAGFYIYDDRQDDLDAIVAECQKGTGVKGTPFSIERLLYPMVNEAALCVEEGVAGPQDIDVSMMAGIGWPQATGGVLHWADEVGLDAVLAGLEGFRKTLGPRFWPAPLLKRMVGAGYTGKKSKRGFFEYV
jgi:3-hydroxyacyl-CoA dehydrogenase